MATLTRLAQAGASECRLIRRGDFPSDMEMSPTPCRWFPDIQSLGLMWEGALPTARQLTQITGIEGLKSIFWEAGSGRADAMQQVLWQASRNGVWNHLVFSAQNRRADDALLGFALNNPNIVNSYSFCADRIVTTIPGVEERLASLQKYARVKPLPGKPLWKTLGTPELLLQFLNRFGHRQVRNWMLMKKDNRVHRIGRSIVYCYRRPHELPEGFMEEICKMVGAGGSVAMQQVRYNLERAFLIAYAMEFNCIVGNSSLKHPRPAYITRLNRQTGLDFTGYLERGYTSVRPEYRGAAIGTRLLEGLTKRTGGKKLYSIIAEDNVATQKIATRNRTRKIATFFSEKAGKEVGVWVPE
ncbi:MAG: hypothetical protein LJE94_03500 [Deltaproteobacteria bacterium]|nr:hypothetical protein [Deltaproteobacteria bacterium]